MPFPWTFLFVTIALAEFPFDLWLSSIMSLLSFALASPVGFMSPDPNAMKNPSYRQVCSGSTGHVEVLNVELSKNSSTAEVFEELCKFLFMFHDPTTLNRQGNDVGTQYASIIFCTSPEQKAIANKVMAELQKAIDEKRVTAYQGKKVETGVVDYTVFYEAHEEHQEYLFKNPNGYCNHRYRFKEWPATTALN
jgi:peptide-methionine (S)-S-oxide reductase